MNLMKFADEVHGLAREKGWYDKPKTDLESLMLIVSEISEAAEHIRAGTQDYHVQPNGKPDGLAVELADAVIRILDYCAYKDIDLYTAMMTKHEYNKTRPYKHGKLI